MSEKTPRPYGTLVIFLFWGLSLAAVFYWMLPDKTVPPELVGTWTSTHPDYSDRYLTLTSDSITFGIGGTSTVIYSIIGVAVEEHHGIQNFVVHFRGVDGTRFRREIVLDEGGTSLHFRSQPGVIWTRLTI